MCANMAAIVHASASGTTTGSGSMSAGQNIERAKKFGVMIAEAVRPLRGVDARFFGFTDSEIFDAGDAQACDVTALRTVY